jgi:hypothetical protein
MTQTVTLEEVMLLKQKKITLERDRQDEHLQMRMDGRASSAKLDSLKQQLLDAEDVLDHIIPKEITHIPHPTSSAQTQPTPEETLLRKKEFEYQIQELQCNSASSH